ncbi:MAG: peptidase M13, partial [Actinomycetales bacterium]
MKPGLDKAELSQTTKPTQDLFRHVNGSWLDSTEIPEDKAVFGSFHMLADDSELAVKEILEEAANNPLPGVSQQIGDLYASFLDEDRVEKLGATPLVDGLSKVNAVSNLKELHSLMGHLERMGVGGLWGSYIDNDPGNPERYLVHFYNGGLGLPDKDYYTDEKYK